MYSPFCRILIQRLVAEKSGGEILLSGKVSGTQEWGGPCGDNDLSMFPGKYSWKSAKTLFSKTIGRRVSDPPGKSVLMVLKII